MVKHNEQATIISSLPCGIVHLYGRALITEQNNYQNPLHDPSRSYFMERPNTLRDPRLPFRRVNQKMPKALHDAILQFYVSQRTTSSIVNFHVKSNFTILAHPKPSGSQNPKSQNPKPETDLHTSPPPPAAGSCSSQSQARADSPVLGLRFSLWRIGELGVLLVP